MYLQGPTGLAISLGWPVINNIRGDIMANKNAYKGSTKNLSSFVKGVKAAQKRKQHRDNLDKMRAQEALTGKNKKRKK